MHFIGHLLTIVIIQPIFNLLVLITAILPGHNFGLSIIIFTVIVRLLMWPLVKKQLHHTKAMQALQPDLKKIKKAAAGDRQKESRMVMELYKEKGMNPFASIGILLVQVPIFIALYLGVRRITYNPQDIINFSYSWLHSLAWIKDLMGNIHHFDGTLFGAVDLIRKPLGSAGTYLPGVVIAAAAGVVQYFQGKQLMPQAKDGRGLRQILGDANRGKQADQTEVNAAVGKSTLFMGPVLIFIFGLSFPTALPLYWFVNSSVAIYQQGKVLNSEEQQIEKEIPGETTPSATPKPKRKKHSSAKRDKRRRRK